MRIEEIHIYGYGKFENVKFTNLGKKQIFFGNNEAGKSTIMSFIHSILFGFPTKQQTELRYEPKKGAKYGGQLIVYFPNYGRAIIERVKGKATGDVVVRLENGQIGGEEFLKELLSSMDKHLYTSIFSFNLHGLQNIHLMKEQDLGKFLFSIGTVGTDQLVKAENQLTKELDTRFKNNGRNPQLNVKLKELQQLRGELKKAERNNDQYLSLLQKRDGIQFEIQQLKRALTECRSKKEKWEKLDRVYPLYQDGKILKNELTQYENITFPDKGIEQLDQLMGLHTQAKRKVNTLEQRLEHLKGELEQLTPNFELIHKENEINTVVENLPLLDKTKQELIGLQAQMKRLEEELIFLHKKIHLPLSQQDIITINTSVFVKEKVVSLNSKQKSLTDKKQELDERFQEEKARLEELESKERELKQELLPEEERKKLEDLLSRSKAKEYVLFQKENMEEKLVSLKKSLQKEKRRSSQHKVQNIVLGILFISLSVWGIFSDTRSFLLLGGLGLLFIIWSFLKDSSAKEIRSIQSEIAHLKEKKSAYEQELRTPLNHFERFQIQIDQDNETREQLKQLSHMLKNQHNQYNHIVDLFEQWEHNEAALHRELLEMGKELKLPNHIALYHLNDAFEIIDELKKMYVEKESLMKRINANEATIKDIVSLLEELSLQLLQNVNTSHHETAYLLKRSLRQELEKHIQYQEKQEQYRQLEEEYKVEQIELKEIGAEIDQLYQIAGTQDEIDFREIGKKAQLKADLINKWNNIDIQLKLSQIDFAELESIDDQAIGEKIEGIEIEIEELEQRITGNNEELADVKHKITMIEEGGTYAELLHRYKQLKYEFESDAKEWVKFSVAKDILQKTINNFKEVWFPKMLAKAEEFLQFLTGGNYIRILPKQDSSGFIIERKDHLLFEANELSQATTEQIYISIRLALAITVYEKYKLPIIIDDSFVNFDQTRTKRVIHLLQELDDNQILFFTCHEHLVEYMHWDDVIDMNEERVVS
ncbi:AAA family ATPase [Niallia sp. Krafla_26]|uniref:ATP-binding protein n=1 Tax=Niallia sp. Krafla_26 TaxID=3064703 RepID=UPI003D1688BE